MLSYSERLTQTIQRTRSFGVVNIDPVLDRLPSALRDSATNPLDAIEEFSRAVVDAVQPHVGIVKFNIAYFEVFGPAGVAVYQQLIRYARERALFVIGDIKRGDVGHTAAQYAQAHLTGDDAADAITINGYFGWDGVQPFAEVADANDRGVFVLVRTSNPSAAKLQDLQLADDRKVHEALAAELTSWNRAALGNETELGAIGAVVATRDRQDAARLRAALPQSWLLIPGYGAQGGTAADFQPYLRPDGLGALVAAGRSVIYAYQHGEPNADWQAAIERAASEFVADLRRIAPNT